VRWSSLRTYALLPSSNPRNVLTLIDKRKWLKPGSRVLLGRTRTVELGDSEALLTIEDKKVSRKHLLISVAPVKAGDGVRKYTEHPPQMR
jgi:hypothetical protein